jgi:biopolymer transport protein ExbB/TolQ
VDFWWIVMTIIVLAVIGTVYVVMRRNSRAAQANEGAPAANRDFVGERETSRLGDMSEEDRAWQAASLEQDRANREQHPPP